MADNIIIDFLSHLKWDEKYAHKRYYEDRAWYGIINGIVKSKYRYLTYPLESDSLKEFLEFIDGNGFIVSYVGKFYGYEYDSTVIKIQSEIHKE